MKKSNVLNSPRLLELKKHRKKDLQNKILISMFALVVIFALFVYVSRISAFNISSVNISGNKVVDTGMVTQIVEQDTSGKYLWLIPKTNIFFYPKNKIKNDLAREFTRLENINISIEKKNILEISVSERTAAYTWCGAVADFTITAENCYFLDKNGYIFDSAPYFSGEVYFKFYGSLTDNDHPAGSYVPKNNFTQLVSFKDTLITMGLKPFALSIDDSGDVHMYLSLQTTAHTYPEIIFKTDADFQNIAENLDSALSTEPLMSDFQNKYASLEYIDLRYGNKVYYKFSK
jgi:cell division septal protein FtsQ